MLYNSLISFFFTVLFNLLILMTLNVVQNDIFMRHTVIFINYFFLIFISFNRFF